MAQNARLLLGSKNETSADDLSIPVKVGHLYIRMTSALGNKRASVLSDVSWDRSTARKMQF